MAKYNKEFNEFKFQELDKRLREKVMTKISEKKKFNLKSIFRPRNLALVLSTLVIGLFIALNPFASTSDVPFSLENSTLEHVNEMMYLSLVYFDEDTTVNNGYFMPLSYEAVLADTPFDEFEKPINSIEALLSKSYSQSSITSVDEDYSYSVDFTVDNFEYTFLFDFTDKVIDGVIVTTDNSLTVSGIIDEDNQEINLTISDGTNELEIVYSIDENPTNVLYDVAIQSTATDFTNIQVLLIDGNYSLSIYGETIVYTVTLEENNLDYKYLLSYSENNETINIGVNVNNSVLLFEVITDNPPINEEYYVDVDYISDQLLLSSFISTRFTSTTDATVINTGITKLSNYYNMAVDTEFENRLSEFDSYVSLLNLFLEGDVLETLNATFTETPLEEYHFHLLYEINQTEYHLDYNIIDQNSDSSLSGDEFILEGTILFDDISYDIFGGLENEEGSMEIWFETVSNTVNIRVEVESDEFEHYYQIEKETTSDYVYYEFRSEKDGLDGTIEFYIEENGIDSYYEMSKEIDSQFTIYYFDYSIGDISGSVTLMIYLDNGTLVKYYIIEEEDYYKEILIPDNSTHPDDM